MLTNPVIDKINKEQLLKDRPSFKVGDTIAVVVRVIEGGKERPQTFQGVVLAIRNRGLHTSFIVRKISHGIGVERTFQLHSRQIQEIRVVRTGLVRQAKIYYMRERSGKSARIAERFGDKVATSTAATETPENTADLAEEQKPAETANENTPEQQATTEANTEPKVETEKAEQEEKAEQTVTSKEEKAAQLQEAVQAEESK